MPEEKSIYRAIPYVDKPVSRILYGTATPALKAGHDEFELLDAVLEMGITTFDTARVYGQAEACMGRWMAARGNRDKLVLLSKCAHPHQGRKRVSEAEIREDFRISSQELQTDYIDIYLLHRDDEDKDVALAVEVMNALHAEGKIGAFGGSNWTHRRIAEANEYAYAHNLIPFTVSSPNFGLAEKVTELLVGGVSIAGPKRAGERAWYAETQMPVVAYSSLARGFFSGKVKSTDEGKLGSILEPSAVTEYESPENFQRLARCEILAREKGCTVSQIALAWILGQEVNAFPVVSASTIGRMEQNVQALHLDLTKEELAWLDLRAEER